MIRVAKNSAHIVIAPGIALPHARPEDGVIDSTVAVVRLAEPVNFGNEDNDPVWRELPWPPGTKKAISRGSPTWPPCWESPKTWKKSGSPAPSRRCWPSSGRKKAQRIRKDMVKTDMQSIHEMLE